MKIVNLIRERREDNESWVDTFEVEDSIMNVEASFRAAVKNFLGTDQGKEEVARTMSDFNWGDAMLVIPDEIWSKHGIHRVHSNVCDVIVNQDETLCTEEDEDEDTEDEVA